MKNHPPFLLTWGLFIAVTAAVTLTDDASAAEYYIGTSGENVSGSSFTSPLTSPAAGWKLNNAGTAVAPTAGNNYTVGGPTVGGNAVGTLLRSPLSGSITFAGDKLTISSGGTFIGKSNNSTGGVGTTLTINNLVLNGGSFYQNTGAGTPILTIAGNISVTATSSLGAVANETLSITSIIAGSNNLVIDGTLNGNTGTGLVRFSGTSSSYTGSITVTPTSGGGTPTLQIGNNGTTGSFSGSTNIINNAILTFNRSNTITQGTDFGVISGTGGNFNTIGTGNLILNAANTFTGQVAIFGGGSLTASSLNSVVSGTASSNLGAPTTVERGTIIMGGNGASGTLIYNGSGETSDRAIRLQAGSTGSNGVIDQSGTGLLKLTGGITSTNSANHVLTLQGSTAGTGEISGAITNGSGLAVTKTGTGTWTLSGSNTYTGTTTVSNGRLALGAGGSIANSSTIDVKSGATLDTTAQSGWTLATGQTLKGTGTVDVGLSKTLTIGSGAFLSPGSSPGTMDVTGSLSFAASSTFTAEISPTTLANDQVTVGGALVIDPSAVLALTLFGFDTVLANGTKFVLVDYTTTWDGVSTFSGYADDSDTTFGLNTYRVDYNDPSLGGTALTLTVVPEPAAVLLGSLGVLTLLRRRRDS